ncbi:zincin [Cylindrobasidium torrendii FP15055 ss-10]|uniref:Neutral protease 2 n=1 Tax=Cylindrobasidium torrendii FP15055 ss-10 TaxID=1314674 RepID=A0A0D7B8R4_9AGAR|nr:zincin [Cylindrobasidium torrendii FP15055 ss-10]
MFAFSTLLLAATVALATPTKRFDGLSVELTSSAGKSLDSVSGLKVTAAVTNNNSEDVKILKYGTVLDNLPTRSFAVTKDGKDVAFSGIKANVRLSDSAYTTLKSGETVTVEHSLADVYDFSSAGTGKFSFAAVGDSLRVAGASDDVSDLKALSKVSIDSKALDIEITKDVARPQRRATPDCSDSDKKSFIEGSYTEGKALASGASDYISSNSDSDLFNSYYSSNSASDVTAIFDAVANEDDSSRTLSCEDSQNACDGNVIAYTLISTTDIYFCDIFFDEVETTELCGDVTVADRKIRGGTTLHEMTHATSETDDVTYGCDADQALSASEQISNADNFNCFSTQVYADTKC